MKRVVSRTALHAVPAVGSVDGVVAVAAKHSSSASVLAALFERAVGCVYDVVAFSAEDDVEACAAEDLVVALTSADDVVAAEPTDDVVALQRRNDVGPRRTNEGVVA